LWVTFGKWIKEGGDVGSDLVLGFGLFTTFEEADDAGLFDSFGDECGSGNGVGFPELLDLVVVGGRVKVRAKVRTKVRMLGGGYAGMRRLFMSDRLNFVGGESEAKSLCY